MSDIDTIIRSNDIVLFQSSGCPYCAQAIAALKAAGKPPLVIEASRDQRNVLSQRTGSSSVPSVWLKGKYVGGCNDGPEPWMGIKKLIANGDINKYL